MPSLRGDDARPQPHGFLAGLYGTGGFGRERAGFSGCQPGVAGREGLRQRKPGRVWRAFPPARLRAPIPPLELGERKTLSKPAQGTEIWENGRVTIAPRQRVDIELDAGAEETAFVFLRGHGGRGASVRIRYAEAYFEPDGKHKDNRLPGDGRALQGYADEIFPAGGEFEYAPFWFRTFRFVRLEIERGKRNSPCSPRSIPRRTIRSGRSARCGGTRAAGSPRCGT